MSAGEKVILFLALACIFFLPLATLLSRTETGREDEEHWDEERQDAPRRHPSSVDGRERIAHRGSSTIPGMRVSAEDGGRK